MDPFREDFNVAEALSSLPCPSDVEPFDSLSDYERDLMGNDPEIFRALRRIDDSDFAALSSETRLGCDVSKRERLKRLQKICVGGATPITVVKSTTKRKVKHIESKSGKTFSCAEGIIFDCLERWATNCDRVIIKLRADASLRIPQEPNRILQGIIVAFDKHWNLILRDIDEVYTPALRLKKVQASPRAIPPSVVYQAKQHGNHFLLERYLKCSLITGSSIICIYKPDEAVDNS